MRNLLLTATGLMAAATLPVSAASAQSFAADGFSGRVTSFNRDFGRGHRDGNHRPRDRRGDVVVGTWVEGGQWAHYNNRTFEPDSFNDWWHDRPDRAYPRWMSNNQNCERMWWSGSGWRC